MPDDQTTRLELTGNPFVDTGLGVLAALRDLSDIEELTLEDAKIVHSDGSQLATWNSSLTSFTMLFTSNSLLTNPSIKDKNQRVNLYTAVLNGLIEAIGGEQLALRCEACGGPSSLDFQGLCRSVIPGPKADDEAPIVGRDWFPLCGSLGKSYSAIRCGPCRDASQSRSAAEELRAVADQSRATPR